MIHQMDLSQYDAINPQYAIENPNWRHATHLPASDIPQLVQPQPHLGSNSRETLQLIADQLSSMLAKALGPDHMYVLVLRTGQPPNMNCNLISNAPIERACELREVFAELSQRQIQTSN